MKSLRLSLMLKSFFTLLLLTLFNLAVLAQEESGSGSGSSGGSEGGTTSVTKTTTSTSVTSENWMAQPWVWVVGAAVFILLLIALMRGNSSRTVSRSDKVVVSKTNSGDAV